MYKKMEKKVICSGFFSRMKNLNLEKCIWMDSLNVIINKRFLINDRK